jgi:hypothetical protein
MAGKYLTERYNGVYQIVGARLGLPIPFGCPAGFSAPPFPPIPSDYPAGLYSSGAVMRPLHGLPFDLEKLFESVRRLNAVQQIDQTEPALLDFVESNWPYLQLAKHRK